jgi:hypothetical protein
MEERTSPSELTDDGGPGYDSLDRGVRLDQALELPVALRGPCLHESESREPPIEATQVAGIYRRRISGINASSECHRRRV